VYQKFWLLTPLDRIRRDLAERGIPLAMSTLVSFIERAADLLSAVDGLHWKQLLAARWMATDGTGLKVIIPKLRTTATSSSAGTRRSRCSSTKLTRRAMLWRRSSSRSRER
jgi:hypothetical protein